MKKHIRNFVSCLLIAILAMSSTTAIAMAAEVHPEDAVVEATEQEFTCDNKEFQSLLNDCMDENTKMTLIKFLATPAYFTYSDDGMTCDEVKAFAENYKVSEKAVEDVKKLSILSGASFEKAFEGVVSERIDSLMENEAKADSVYFYEEFVNDYVKRYAPEYTTQLKIKKNPSLEMSVNASEIQAIKTKTIYPSSSATNPYGDVIAYITCTIVWNWDTATGQITYLAPSTTKFWDPDWTEFYKWRSNTESLSTDRTSGYVSKNAEFRGYWNAICSIYGNVYYGGSDDMTDWDWSSPSN